MNCVLSLSFTAVTLSLTLLTSLERHTCAEYTKEKGANLWDVAALNSKAWTWVDCDTEHIITAEKSMETCEDAPLENV